ncbi:tRNA pseudouridine(55) synthase TruB, partial [uncultured Treponema sp.]
MPEKTKNKVSGVMLYAKTPGITSFSSLWSIKHALKTEKVGHTGTLDSFAEGLLVVLSGNLTHLVPHITSFTKTYQAVVCFGKETDTLDPTGDVIKTGAAASKEQIESALKKFTGAVLQVPPVYSALHVDGKRASDLVRGGNEIHLESRQVFVYKNELLDFKEPSENDSCSYALLEIVCSKGTYIRALARDIASSLGTCAHLCALRRTKVSQL